MSDCRNGGRCYYSEGIASAIHEERIAQLESRNKSLVEFDVNVRQRDIKALKERIRNLEKQLDCERDIRARKSRRIETLERENDEMRELLGKAGITVIEKGEAGWHDIANRF